MRLIMNLKSMFKSISLFCVLFSLTGCVYLVVGGVGALGGYVVSPDTVEGLTQTEQSVLWDASIEILSIMGTISEQNEKNGTIQAKISGSKVSVAIIPVSTNNVRLKVKARKAFLPKISVAQDVFVKIMSRTTE